MTSLQQRLEQQRVAQQHWCRGTWRNGGTWEVRLTVLDLAALFQP